MTETTLFGWDIGGAHVKVSRLQGGLLQDTAQWPCPLWQGLEHLDRVLAVAKARWPDLTQARHAVTMTGEMVDLFEHREQGVRSIAQRLETALGALRFYAGDAGWCDAGEVQVCWDQIASANWLATARHCAQILPREQGMLIDIGSTTTDLTMFRHGEVLTRSRADVQRLARNELVYQGVVRTPLCAIAPRIAWRDQVCNVMNEFFATTADVYRLTGELDEAHDQHPSADNGAKDLPGSRRRLARMIGLDARDGSDEEWLAFARNWRGAQLEELRMQVRQLCDRYAMEGPATVVSAGCGAFLVPELLRAGWRHLSYGEDLLPMAGGVAPERAKWSQVCAPSVAVAALFQHEHQCESERQ